MFWEKYTFSMDFQLTDPFHCVWAVEENLAQFSKDENWHLTQMPRLLQRRIYSYSYIHWRKLEGSFCNLTQPNIRTEVCFFLWQRDFSAQACCWLVIPSVVLTPRQSVEISNIIDLSNSFHLLADHSINLCHISSPHEQCVFLFCFFILCLQQTFKCDV